MLNGLPRHYAQIALLKRKSSTLFTIAGMTLATNLEKVLDTAKVPWIPMRVPTWTEDWFATVIPKKNINLPQFAFILHIEVV